MKTLKPGESETISFGFILDNIKKRIEHDYDEIVIEKHKIVLALDEGV